MHCECDNFIIVDKLEVVVACHKMPAVAEFIGRSVAAAAVAAKLSTINANAGAGTDELRRTLPGVPCFAHCCYCCCCC